MSKKLYIGVDPSITSPGVSCVDEDGNIVWMKFFASKPKWEGYVDKLIYGVTYPIYSNDTERFHKIGSIILEMILTEIKKGHDVKVCLEGYSYGSTASRLFQIAENGGHFKFLCWQNNIDITVSPPTVIKKFATGKGNANKELMYSSFVEKYGIQLHTIFGLKTNKAISPISDIADAVFMADYIRCL